MGGVLNALRVRTQWRAVEGSSAVCVAGLFAYRLLSCIIRYGMAQRAMKAAIEHLVHRVVSVMRSNGSRPWDAIRWWKEQMQNIYY